jgi:hypothetical protein
MIRDLTNGADLGFDNDLSRAADALRSKTAGATYMRTGSASVDGQHLATMTSARWETHGD